MSFVDRIRSGAGLRRSSTTVGSDQPTQKLSAHAAPAAPKLPPGGGAAVMPADLMNRRRELALDFAEVQWDLGGLAYEMASRDHFRPDVLVRRAAELQEVDAELGEIERLLRMDESGAAGSCPSCGALHGRSAVFCWQCGTQLMPSSDDA
ncbi:MAG: hypothetical protein ACR2ML_12480 [Solirubrobacteraceae bacterium]